MENEQIEGYTRQENVGGFHREDTTNFRKLIETHFHIFEGLGRNNFQAFKKDYYLKLIGFCTQYELKYSEMEFINKDFFTSKEIILKTIQNKKNNEARNRRDAKTRRANKSNQ